jgi:hypothetical protein
VEENLSKNEAGFLGNWIELLDPDIPEAGSFD